MARHYTTVLTLLVLAGSVLAHEHHNEISEEEQKAPVDTILWLHIFLQAAVWGILFPTGMVLGLSRSRWHVPLQVCVISVIIRSLTYPSKECRIPADSWRVRPGSLTRRESIPRRSAWKDGEHHAGAHRLATLPRHLSQVAYPRGDYPTMGCEAAWSCWEGVPHLGLGTDAIRCDRVQRLLPWRELGTVPRPLYHGTSAMAHSMFTHDHSRAIQGSGFIAYGTIMAILLLVGEAWVRRSGRSPDWWDSWVIMLWVRRVFLLCHWRCK